MGAAAAKVGIEFTGEDKTKSAFDSVKRQAMGLKDSFEGVKAAALGFAAAVGVGELAGWVKGAIDAADALNDMADRTGIAATTLSGYTLAAKLADTDMDGLAKGMAKLAKNMADGSDAFKAMGVSTKDASGKLKGTDVMLGELADKFASYEDGPAKAALAMELFGKSGTDLIPFLNQGSAGLAEMKSQAEQLGITLDQNTITAAAAFNDKVDTLTLGAGGYATRLSADLLPALGAVADSLLGNVNQAGALQVVMDGLGFTIKSLASIGYGLVAVFDQVGSILAAGAAQVVAFADSIMKAIDAVNEFAHGNVDAGQAAWTASKNSFNRIGEIGNEWMAQAAEKNEQYATKINQIWSELPKNIDDHSPKSTAIEAPKVKDFTDAAAKAKSAYEELEKAAKKFGQDLGKQNIESGLDEFQKLRVEAIGFAAPLKNGTQLLAQWNRQIDEYAQKKGADDAVKAFIKAQESAAEAIQSATKSLTDQLTTAEWERDTFDMSASAITGLTIARKEEAIARLQQANAFGPLEKSQRDEIAAMQEQLELLGRIRNAQGATEALGLQKQNDEALAKNADDFLKKVQDRTDQIGQSLTDALMQGFDNGKTFAQNFRDTLKNMFMTLILRPQIEAIVNPAAGAANSLITTVLNGIGSLALGSAGVSSTVGVSTGYANDMTRSVIPNVIPSAARGFDIPAGVNPMTQLHEEEMVLPAEHADVIRSLAKASGQGMASNTNAAAASSNAQFNFYTTIDAKSGDTTSSGDAGGYEKFAAKMQQSMRAIAREELINDKRRVAVTGEGLKMPTFNVSPDYAAAVEVDFHVEHIRFGGGFSQRWREGIAPPDQAWSLQFSRGSSVVDAVADFLDALNGTGSFEWTDPRGRTGLFEAMGKYTYRVDSYGIRTLTVTFQRVPA